MKVEVEKYEYDKITDIIQTLMDNAIIEEDKITFSQKADDFTDTIVDVLQGSY